MKAATPSTVLLLSAVLIAVAASGCSSAPPIVKNASSIDYAKPIAPGMARVYFLRPSEWKGGHYKLTVWRGMSLIGYIRSGQAFFVDVAAGQHDFMVRSNKNASVMHADLAPGMVYFARCHIIHYYMGASIYLEAINRNEDNWDLRHEWALALQGIELIPQNVGWWEQHNAAKNKAQYAKWKNLADKKTYLRQADGEPHGSF